MASLFAAKKIVKEKGQDPEPFELDVAQALCDLEANSNDLKAELRELRRELLLQKLEEGHLLTDAEAAELRASMPSRLEVLMDRMREGHTLSEDEKAELEEAFKQQQAEMQEHFGALQQEKDEQKQLEDKLAAMQAKVMKGGTNLLDQAERLKEEQRRQEAELEKIAAAEAEAQRRVKELEELQSITGDNYKNVEEEIEAKGKKIKKLYQAYQRCQADIKDLDLEFNQEREDLLAGPVAYSHTCFAQS